MNFFNKENETKKLIIVVTFGIILYCLLQNFEAVKHTLDVIFKILIPFVVGAGIAFVVNIPMSFLENKIFKINQANIKRKKASKFNGKKACRIVSMVLSYAFIIFIIALVVELIIPQLISVIIIFFRDIPNIAYNVKEYAINLTEQYPDISSQIQNININWDEITKEAIANLSNLLKNVVSSSIGMVISLIGGIINAVVAIIFSVYILLSKENLKLQVRKLILAYSKKKNAEDIFKIADLSEKTFTKFITGQFTEAMILGTLCFLGTLILQTPYGATISVLIGVTALVPIVGAIIGGLVGAILVLSISYGQAIAFVIFLIILQQVETNIIYPRVVGSSIGLPGIWVLLAVAVGGKLFGVLGLIIGLPVVSVAYTILRENVNKRLKKIEVV